jgi:hypothetical protein
VEVILSDMGETPELRELFLSSATALNNLDLGPLAGHGALASLTACVEKAIELGPLASTPLTSLSMRVGGASVIDFVPLRGHRTLKSVALDFCGTQAKLDLSFARDLPALESLSIAGGDWTELDLRPLEGISLRSLTLHKMFIAGVDLELIAQPALEHLMLQDLEIRVGYLDLGPLAKCTKLRFLSLHGNEVGTIEVSALARLADLGRFDPPNFKNMLVSAHVTPIVSPGLRRWEASIGVEQ